MRVSAPVGSILNTQFPAPVKARAKTINNLNQVLFGALWPIFGGQAQASNGGIWPLVLKGVHRGVPFLVDMLPHGGRGGLPHVGDAPITFSLTPDRITTRPQGFAGGHEAEVGTVRINGVPTYRFPAIELQPGDTVELELAGGGGFGPPEQREPERIRHDLRHEDLTPAAARDQYGFDPDRDAPD